MLIYMLLFNINWKAYVGSPFEPLHLTLVTLISRDQGHSKLGSRSLRLYISHIISRKEQC